MYLVITILILIAALLMVLIVLVQNSKGGGLAAGFSSSNQIMGAPKTADFLEKATWSLAGAIMVLCVLSSSVMPKNHEQNASAIQEYIQNAPEQNTTGFPIQPATEAVESTQAGDSVTE
ncbi:MAG: preprotein translocase subunit SecG [Bacteroidales bacterium]